MNKVQELIKLRETILTRKYQYKKVRCKSCRGTGYGQNHYHDTYGCLRSSPGPCDECSGKGLFVKYPVLERHIKEYEALLAEIAQDPIYTRKRELMKVSTEKTGLKYAFRD